MNCRSAESLFSSYIEDEISQEERRNLEAHFMGCRRCSIAMRDVRATMSAVEQMPVVSPGAHFDEEVFARIRSGEGLRPTALELIRELLAPARLRPVYLAGAGACAVALAVLVSPVGHGWMRPANSPSTVAARPQGSATVVPGETAGAPSVFAPIVSERIAAASPGATTAPAERRTTVVASAPVRLPAGRDSTLDQRPRYNDEIVNDLFYLERGRQGQTGQTPSVVPVNETQDDGVYIIF